ncbi:MAG: TonB-dependent receptor [Pseudomonadales bacterium]|nr:TonB-dependent receptor [Pseudomonadales bacterium]
MKMKPFRRHVRGGAVALLTATTIPFAQNALAQEIEEVIITGSRIARDANLTGALPVESISAEDIRKSGEFSLSDVVNDVPALLQSVTGEQSIDAAAQFEDGSNILDLRGLGAERTLVLVNGRRHVGGLAGTSAVDVGSIPQALVERVEVLTGGASAVYGADAVTGVVNFILRDDFEGLEVDANYRMSEYGDGGQASLSAVYGFNFDNDRGNVTVALDMRDDEGLVVGDRGFAGLRVGSGRDWVNPDLRFQPFDLGEDTPNFGNFYDFGQTGRFFYGLPIPTQEDFIADYTAEFGAAPNLTSAETALINRAANAPQRAVLPFRTFPFTSGYGYIIPGNPFTFSGFDPETPIDLNGNGRPDCLDSFTGYNSVFGAESFGVVGGCWNIDRDGNYAPVQDGLVSGNFQGFGGDGYSTSGDDMTEILLPDERISLNLLGNYALNDQARAFAELKYVNQEVSADARPGSFWDLLFGAADNPYLPDFIQPVADANGGVAITVDPLHFGSRRTTERDTARVVVGVEGEFDNGWTYEFSANYGRFDQEIAQTGSVINDRFFAAIDAVTDPATGQPACRADVDPSAPAQNTPFEIPAYEAGYFSFTPGAGSCVPLNIWAGQPGVTQQARDWVTVTELDEITIEQTVLAASFAGDLSDLFELPGGAVAFAAGVEWREEKSDARFDNWQRGILPAGSPFGEGTQLGDVSENTSLTFRPQLSVKNETGEFDATDVFVEFSLPLLADAPFAEELTVDLAARYSDYSTIGSAESWKTNVVWAPIEDIAFRGGVSRAVRAPNVTELFGPETGINFRPIDPCDAAQLNALEADNPALAQNTRANCVADFNSFGLDPFDADGNYVFADPLSASFGGLEGGNRNLTEETGDTITAGFIFQPTFFEGFTLTVDYWQIEIEDAIQAVDQQDIVNGCYQGASLNASFCGLLSRNMTPTSAQFGGFNFLRSTDINFAKLETDGYDISANYTFDIGAHNFEVNVSGTKVESLNNFTNPLDLNDVDVELGEVNRPEEAGNIFLTWNWGDLSVGWQTQYLGEMLVSFLEIDTAVSLYGDSVIMDETWIHDLNATYIFNDNFTFYGGINNITQENPFLTDHAFPASPRGRMIFLGATYRM